MKKDVAFAIVLMVAGGLGLVFPPKFGTVAEPAAVKPAHEVRIEPAAKSSGLTSEVTVIKCTRNVRTTETKANLLHKVSVAFADLDSVISLQSM
jgi:hypothetical protein